MCVIGNTTLFSLAVLGHLVFVTESLKVADHKNVLEDW